MADGDIELINSWVVTTVGVDPSGPWTTTSTDVGLVDPWTVTFTDLEQVAQQRHLLHEEHPSHRPLSVDYELVGLVGEWTFGRWAGLPIDLSLRPAGDGRSDFEIEGYTIDVKTARKAYNLLREAGKPHADILVLAHWQEGMVFADLLGWQWDSVMLKQPIKTFGIHTVQNHYQHQSRLRKMRDLKVGLHL